MADLQGRKVFKVFNQDFIVDERYNVTKELGQGAYGIVWYVRRTPQLRLLSRTCINTLYSADAEDIALPPIITLGKALLSKKSPMYSVRRSSRSGLCARSNYCNTFEVIET